MKSSSRNIAQIALMVSIIAICAQIAIPIGGVPMTLQTFAIALCGYLYGMQNGILTVSVYLALGILGMPIFTGFAGSAAVLFGPTGGFLFGFLPFVLCCGCTKNIRSPFGLYLFSLIGLVICHIIGISYFSFLSKIPWISAWLTTSFPYFLKDILSLLFAHILTKKIRQRLPHLFLFRNQT